MAKVFHRAYSAFKDTLTGVEFTASPMDLGEGVVFVAAATVDDAEIVAALVARGFEVEDETPKKAKK